MTYFSEEPTLESNTSVPISYGWDWFVNGIALFFKYPFQWTVSIFSFFLVMNIVGAIPIVNLVLFFTGPLFAGGFMLSALEADKGEGPGYFGWAKGFTQNTDKLLLLGAAQAGIYLLAMGLLFSILYLSGFLNPSQITGTTSVAALPLIIIGISIFAFSICLSALFWAAPALIAIHGTPVFQAIKESFIGGLKNILAFLFYSILMLLFFAVTIGLIFGALLVITWAMEGQWILSGDLLQQEIASTEAIQGSAASILAAYLPLIILTFVAFLQYTAIGICGIYLAYRDIYTD